MVDGILCPNSNWPMFPLKKEYKFDFSKVKEEYQRYLMKTASEKIGGESDDYCYCLEAYMEASSTVYQAIVRFAMEHEFDTVVDIGCACGVQGDLFRQVGIQYLGIECCSMKMFPGIKYLQKKYPCELDLQPMGKVLGVSNLCVGFLIESYQEIASQFHDFLLCSCREGYDGLAQYYDTHVILQEPEQIGLVWYHH